MKRIIIYLILLLLPFSSALALNNVLTLSFGFACVLLGCIIFSRVAKVPYTPHSSDGVLFFMAVMLLFGFLAFSNHPKCLNHLLMWTIPPLVFYFSLRRALFTCFTLNEIKEKVLAFIFITTTFTAAFAIFEFIGKNFLGMDIDSWLPRAAVETMDDTAMDRVRARAFSEEPGQFSFFLEAFSPLSLYWVHSKYKKKVITILYGFLLFCSLLVSFSAAGFALSIVGLLLFFLFFTKENKYSTIKLFIMLIILIVLFGDYLDLFFSIITSKLDGTNTSFVDRENRFSALEKIGGINMLIGYGPGSFYTLDIDSYISLYLGIFMNLGFVGVISFIMFVIQQYKSICMIRDIWIKAALLTSFVMMTLHLAVVDYIYYAWYWVVLSVAWVVLKKETYEKKCVRK